METTKSGSPAHSGGIPAGVAVSLAVLLLTLVAFSPVLSSGFVDFDDPGYVTRNLQVRSGLTWEGFRWAFVPSNRTYWSPLTWLSLMLNVQVFGVRPGPIHAVNLLLHAGSAILLFLALARMTGRVRLSSAVALVYAVHPLHVEVVAWAAERKTVLAGSLAFAALLAYARYAERPSARRYASVAALFVLSLLAKQMVAATLPALFLVLDVWPLGRTRWVAAEREDLRRPATPLKALVLEKLPLLAVVAIVTGVIATSMPLAANVPLLARAATAVTSCWGYLAKAVWPTNLAVFYPERPSIPMWEWGVAAAGLAAVTGALLTPRAPRAALVGWLWFLGTVLPFLGLVRHATRQGMWPSMADRFMYFPLAGLLVAAGWTIAPALKTRRLRTAAAAVVAAVVVAATARSNAYARQWHDSEMLFRTAFAAAARIAPEMPTGHMALGILRQTSGDLAGAEAEYRRALAVQPDYGEALYNLALIERKRRHEDEARDLLERAVRAGFEEGADAADAYNDLGSSYRAIGRFADAEWAFREALRRHDLHWYAAVNLAWMLAEQRRRTEALALLDEARRRALRQDADPAPIDEATREIDALAP